MANDASKAAEAALRAHGHENPAEVIRALAKLFAVFPERGGQGHPPERVAAYAEHLADLPLRSLQWVIAASIREGKWLPTIAELRERVAREQMASAGISGAEAAWERVMRMIGKHGTATLPQGGFGDPITDAVMTGPVWRQLGQTETDMLPSERKAFIDAYRAREANMRQAAQRGTLPALQPAQGQQARQLVEGLAQQLTRKEPG